MFPWLVVLWYNNGNVEIRKTEVKVWELQRRNLGRQREGKTAYLYTLNNSKGMKAAVSDFAGGSAGFVGAFRFRMEALKDVVLGFDELEGYFENESRIRGCHRSPRQSDLEMRNLPWNGKEYHLAKNDGENNLHSNPHGYHRRLWEAEVCESELGEAVACRLFSPDGDQGFPGNLDVTVTSALTEENSLMIHYYASGDQDTVINMTNHSYFNLSGHDAGHAVDQEAPDYCRGNCLYKSGCRFHSHRRNSFCGGDAHGFSRHEADQR